MYQMMITLNDEEYAALQAEAIKRGKTPEEVLHDLIRIFLLDEETESTEHFDQTLQ